MGEEFGMRELIGEVIHNELWAVWMRNLMSCCVRGSDGSLSIPPDKVEYWGNLANSSFDELSKAEQESDREQADLIIDRLVRYAVEQSKLDRDDSRKIP